MNKQIQHQKTKAKPIKELTMIEIKPKPLTCTSQHYKGPRAMFMKVQNAE
jgi:hypothetical protein